MASPQAASEVKRLLYDLSTALVLEDKYLGSIQPISSPNGGITSGMRDGSAHVLRCLKVWYDLPSEVFFTSVCCIDRFLSKMKAQSKHLSCIAVSAFHWSCLQYKKLENASPISIPEPADLVCISQSRCSPSDLLRMESIIASKLETNPVAGPEAPVTSLEFLRLMFSVCKAASIKLGQDLNIPDRIPDRLLHQLEILVCDSMTLQYRPSEVALALLAANFQRRTEAMPQHGNVLMGFIAELQKYCSISSNNFVSCLNIVLGLLEKYNGECSVAHRQRLVWKLSNRTLKHLRPTDKLRRTLPTINETGQMNVCRNRSSSESSTGSLESLSDSEMDISEGWDLES